MSNHEIGEAMSSLGTDIIELYEAGKISKEAARSLIGSCMCIVTQYDGNEYEATESIAEAGYCGLCFEKHQDLSDVFNNDDDEDIKNSGYGDTFMYRTACRSDHFFDVVRKQGQKKR